MDMGGQGQNNLSHGPIDMNAMDDAREQFMQYQVSFMQSSVLSSYLILVSVVSFIRSVIICSGCVCVVFISGGIRFFSISMMIM